MSGAVRWARATTLAAVVLTLGAVAHVQGNGHLPGPVTLAALAAVSVGVCAAWLGRPASPRRLVVLTAVGQAGVHLVLSLTEGHVPTPPGHVHAQSHAHAHPAPLFEPLLHVAQDAVRDLPMAAAHLVAAVLVGLWLAAGERSLWTLVALAARHLLAPVALLAAAVLPRPVAVRRGAPRPRTTTPPAIVTLRRVVVRRGPPALLPA